MDPLDRIYGTTTAVAVSKFEETQSTSDLERAIRLSRRLLTVDHVDDPSLDVCRFFLLARLLWWRYERTDDISDIDETIKLFEMAAEIADRHSVVIGKNPALPTLLDGQAQALKTAFQHSGSLSLLEEAVQCRRLAVKAHPAGNGGHYRYQYNLAVILKSLADESDAADDGHEEAFLLLEEANDKCPDLDPRKPIYLIEVACLQRDRFSRTGNVEDIDRAVRLGRKAVELARGDHRDRVGCWSRLATILAERYKKVGTGTDTSDIDEAIQLLRRAVDATHGDKHDEELINLGVAYVARYERLGEDADRIQAIEVLREVAQSATARPSKRIGAAHEWGYLEARVESWRDAATAHELAVELLGQAAPHTLARSDQERVLGRRRGLASDAAACFLHLGDTRRAVELLEQGRGVLLGRAIEARSDLTELAAKRPDLAKQFTRLRTVLDAVSDRDVPDASILDDFLMAMPAEIISRSEKASQSTPRPSDLGWREKLLVRRDALLDEIRELPGFERFLLAPEASQLVDAAKHGPVVIVNVSQFRSDAIILDPTINAEGIDQVPLPGLSPQWIDDVMMADEFTGGAGVDRESTIDVDDDEEELRRVLGWLWDTVASKILKRLGITAQADPSASLPRLWWCPTGSLSFLPIHAAGYYDQPGAPSVLDCVVSSYTPTVRALVHARKRVTARAGGDDQTGRLLVVAMPHTPGLHDLPGTRFESRFLRDLFPNRSSILEGPDANYHNVQATLQQSRWVHFACHAEAKGDEPFASRLILSDVEQRPLTVGDISRLDLDGTDLAFLSACESALGGDLAMADESIHLASAFQLAGFPCVIATLWPVRDNPTKKIVRNFYTALASNTDPSRAAQLLHNAIRKYRLDRERYPSMWAFFIHAGA